MISALVEGCSVRSTSRMTGVSRGAVLRLLVSVGNACAEYQDRVIRNVHAKRGVQRSFFGMLKAVCLTESS